VVDSAAPHDVITKQGAAHSPRLSDGGLPRPDRG
jgi:hypothetical protein